MRRCRKELRGERASHTSPSAGISGSKPVFPASCATSLLHCDPRQGDAGSLGIRDRHEGLSGSPRPPAHSRWWPDRVPVRDGVWLRRHWWVLPGAHRAHRDRPLGCGHRQAFQTTLTGRTGAELPPDGFAAHRRYRRPAAPHHRRSGDGMDSRRRFHPGAGAQSPGGGQMCRVGSGSGWAVHPALT